jgi:hypothetical protein
MAVTELLPSVGIAGRSSAATAVAEMVRSAVGYG